MYVEKYTLLHPDAETDANSLCFRVWLGASDDYPQLRRSKAQLEMLRAILTVHVCPHRDILIRQLGSWLRSSRMFTMKSKTLLRVRGGMHERA